MSLRLERRTCTFVRHGLWTSLGTSDGRRQLPILTTPNNRPAQIQQHRHLAKLEAVSNRPELSRLVSPLWILFVEPSEQVSAFQDNTLTYGLR